MSAHEPIELVENPETGEKTYPWMTRDGRGIETSGAVEDCDCDVCVERTYAEDMRPRETPEGGE